MARDHIFTYKEDWEKLSLRIGFWLDYSRPYITFSPEYIESVWWALSQFHEERPALSRVQSRAVLPALWDRTVEP